MKIQKEVRKDIRTYNTRSIEEAIEDNANMKVLRSKLSIARHRISQMKDQSGNMISNNNLITEHIKDFYTRLYTSIRPNPTAPRSVVCNVGSEDIPEITRGEIRAALKQMKKGKCSGEDKITCEMLKEGGTP